jgi:hypothetical protein
MIHPRCATYVAAASQTIGAPAALRHRDKCRAHAGHLHPGHTFVPASVVMSGRLCRPIMWYLRTLSEVASARSSAVTRGSFLASAHQELSVGKEKRLLPGRPVRDRLKSLTFHSEADRLSRAGPLEHSVPINHTCGACYIWCRETVSEKQGIVYKMLYIERLCFWIPRTFVISTSCTNTLLPTLRYSSHILTNLQQPVSELDTSRQSDVLLPHPTFHIQDPVHPEDSINVRCERFKFALDLHLYSKRFSHSCWLLSSASSFQCWLVSSAFRPSRWA